MRSVKLEDVTVTVPAKSFEWIEEFRPDLAIYSMEGCSTGGDGDGGDGDGTGDGSGDGDGDGGDGDGGDGG